MQSFMKREIAWIAQEMSDKAIWMQNVSEAADTADVERGLCQLRSEQYRSLAERLAKAVENGDKRIAIR